MADERWLSPAEQEAWQAYLASYDHLMRALDRQLRRDSGLTHADYAVLVRLSQPAGARARITDLAGFLEHSQSRMSHAVARLERAGYVRRDADPDDGRVVHVMLTDTGRAALRAAAPGHVRCVRENLFDELTPAQLDAFRDVVTSMLARMSDRGH